LIERITAMLEILNTADPAIIAAHIAARATLRAAWIQGLLTFAAGIFVIVGAWLALRGAVDAAQVQVRLAEKRDAARVAAYRHRIRALIEDIEPRVVVVLNEGETALGRYNEIGGHYQVAVFALPSYPDLAEQHWENHALLGLGAVRAIYKARLALQNFATFQQEVDETGLRCDDHAERYQTFGNRIDNEDGSITYETEAVVEENVTLLKEIKTAIVELKAAIGGEAA
jgi:hypothetical protein